MAFPDLLFVSAGLFLAGLVKGISGLGYSSFALPVLVLTLDVGQAMALITFPVIASNIAVLMTLRRVGPALKRFWPLYLSLMPGIAGGVFLVTALDRKFALQLLGVVTLVYVGVAVLQSNWRIVTAWERALNVPVGLVTGLITGLTGSQLVPLVPYLSSTRMDSGEQVQAINIAVTIGSVALAVMLIWNGLMTRELATASAGGIAPAIAGVSIGAWLALRLPRRAFRWLVLTIVAMIALSLIFERDRDFASRKDENASPGRIAWEHMTGKLSLASRPDAAPFGERSAISPTHSHFP